MVKLYNRCEANSSILERKKSALRLPVGRENCRKPLGPSGHFRLHAVVGSKLIVKGIPHCRGFPVQRL